MPKVSIVVPVYNVERYLCQCLDSIICQTLQDIEVVCVDDGSTDASTQILDKYAENDSRFVVIHKKNEGYGKAMNLGIQAAQGKYVGIVESDDWVLPEMYETLYETAEAHQLDVVKSDYYHFLFGSQVLRHVNSLDSYYNQLLRDGQREIMFQFLMHNWSGIYLRDFLSRNHIYHQETPGAAYQDNGFWLQVMAQCQSAMWLDRAFYMYRQDNPTSSMKRRDRMMLTMEEHNFAERLLRQKGLEQEARICAYYRMRDHRFTFLRVDDALKREYTDIAIEDYRKYKPQIISEYFCKDPTLFHWLDTLSEHPDQICDRILKRNKDVLSRLDKAKKIILYGAGQVAADIGTKLFHTGYYDKIDCIVVSNHPDKENFMGLQVKKSDVIVQYETAPLVLVCVSKKYGSYSEIVERLRELNCTDYMDIDDFRYISP